MESSILVEKAAAAWLAKRDGDCWSEADAAQLERWLEASTANRVAFLRLDAAWQRANRLRALGAGVKPGAVPAPGEWRSAASPEKPAKAARPAPTASRRQGRLGLLALAASVLFATVIGTGWYLWPAGPSYRTPVGGLAEVPMPDGSRITLNTDSEIHVAVSRTERRVELARGEAFFEVAEDRTRPFVVAAGVKRIVAVGTRFSVRRDDDTLGEVLVVVTKGRVRVESGAARVGGAAVPRAEVSAGRIARSSGSDVLIQERPLAEAEEMLSWRSGYLVFKDVTLAQAVAEFNRYNFDKIVIEDASVAGMRIGGNFRSTNVAAFVRLLEDGFPIRVERRDQRIVLSRS